MSQREYHEQVKLINWCIANKDNELLPNIDRIFSIPNGAHVSKAQRGKLVAEGMRAGVSDMFLPVPRRKFFGLWIEMKAPAIVDAKGKQVKPKGATKKNQKEWLSSMSELGYACIIVYGRDEAVSAILNYYGVHQLGSGKIVK